MAASSLLFVEDVHKSFGGVKALDGVTLSVTKGSIVGLIGPNGSGKTTLFRVVTGFHQPDVGRIIFNGEGLNGLTPDRVTMKGLVKTFQICRLFPKMTVLENMLVAPKHQTGELLFSTLLRRRTVVQEEGSHIGRAEELLRFLDLLHLRDEYAANLSGGQRKLLELGRVLMTDPKMILLDEPIAGVNPVLTRKIVDRIFELRRSLDMTFLVVEHNMDVIMNTCDRIYVMHRGRIVAEGAPEEVQSDPKVIDVYLGG